MNQIVMKKVTHIYHIPNRKLDIPILHDINTRFDTGDIHFILGPSGSGKTTLLKIIAGILKPTAGEVTDETGNPIINHKISMLHQTPTLNTFPHLTVRDNIIIQYRAMGKSPEPDVFLHYAEALNLTLELDRKVRKYSMGQIQRIGLALALLKNDPVLILDEPTSHLDMINARKVIKVLKKDARERKKLVIIASHSQELAEQHQFQVLVDGRLVNQTLDAAIEEYLRHKQYFSKHDETMLSGTIEFKAECIDGMLKLPPFILALGDWTRQLVAQKKDNELIIQYEPKQVPSSKIEMPNGWEDGSIHCVLNLDTKSINVRLIK